MNFDFKIGLEGGVKDGSCIRYQKQVFCDRRKALLILLHRYFGDIPDI